MAYSDPGMKFLFRGDRLDQYLNDLRAQAARNLEIRDADWLLTTPEVDLIEQYRGQVVLECPRLLTEEAWREPVKEVEKTLPPPDVGLGPIETTTVRLTSITLVVPFVGDREIFNLSPSTLQIGVQPEVPEAVINDGGLRITWEGTGHDPATVEAYWRNQLNAIKKKLEQCKLEIDKHNHIFEAEIPHLVTARREKLLADRQMQAALSFPLRRRPDANTYAVPIRRRQLAAVRQSPSETFRPELVLEDNNYEDALAVLCNSRNALERSPSLASKLSEEHIRDLLLIKLNAQFEGRAAGEVFNGAGKTDILIRAQDRNVFIGECKIWGGPKTVTAALDQLLSYLVWRDTKAALILLIRGGDVTAIIKKAVDQIDVHPNFKRRSQHDTDERVDFVMHANGDPAREIRLTLLPFHVPKVE